MEHDQHLDSTLQTAISIAHEAGALVRKAFPKTALQQVGFKGAVNPVTETDLAAEALITGRLREAFPEHRILAEEGGGDDWRTAGPPIWLVDPLDGTNNFAHGYPCVSVSLGMVVDGQVLAGVVYDPLRDETFAARAGGGATLNGAPIHVTAVEQLAQAFLATGFPYDRRTAADNNTQRLDHFLRRSQGVRRGGSAALDLSYVACGRLDGFWELRLSPWDMAAGILLVREAGGRANDAKGQPDCLGSPMLVASNDYIHEQMLRVIQEGANAPRPEG
ncbi:MAG: inositol monophosphatase [Thermoflexales bacterium]|nr:inositol monophosphatase [Thermoflexales bacterium]